LNFGSVAIDCAPVFEQLLDSESETMLTSHELFGFMPAALAAELLEFAFTNDKELYKATLSAVAQLRKVRPVFMERQPRPARHAAMISTLSKPALDLAAGNLLRGWLVKKHKQLLADFLDSLGIPHKDGTVEDLPATVEDEKLKVAVEAVLAKHPKDVTTVYLHAFNAMNDTKWPNLDAMLKGDSRLQF
jgi:hypothetical protein